MAASPGQVLLEQVDALRKHEEAFLNLHRQLINEIVEAGRKYSKFIPGDIMQKKGIRYYSAVMEKRVDYERRNENAYRRARVAFLISLRRLGQRNLAMFFFNHWKTIEKTLPQLEKAIMNQWNFAQGAANEERQIYQIANELYLLQEEIVNGLRRTESMLKGKLAAAVGGRV